MGVEREAPFPWFGKKPGPTMTGVWRRLGNVDNLVVPFAGSLSEVWEGARQGILPGTVTLNDADGFLVNVWRAIQSDPIAVARWINWPVTELDLFARHVWLVRHREELVGQLMADPDWFDAKAAGWWIWGACAWIGTGWCSGDGPWWVEDGQLVNIRERPDVQEHGVRSKLPHMGNKGQGVNRKLPHLSKGPTGVNRQLPHLAGGGRGVNRELGITGTGSVAAREAWLVTWLSALSDTLRECRIACGDWKRVVTPAITTGIGLTGVVLDPPYGEGVQEYAAGGNSDGEIAQDVWAWAVANGGDPLLRIAVCAYDDGRAIPPGWTTYRWKAKGGYGVQGDGQARVNSGREIIYFSPHCLHDLPMFSLLDSLEEVV